MASLNYVSFNRETKTMMYIREDGEQQSTSQLGDDMLSFITLDLSFYESIRLDIEKYFDQYLNDEVMDFLINKYPILQVNYSNLSSNYTKKDLFEEYLPELLTMNNAYSNQTEVQSHPYIKYAETFYPNFFNDLEGHIRYDANLSRLQNTYKLALPFCFDINYNPNLNQLTAYERYYLFIRIYKHLRYTIENTIDFSIIHLPYEGTNSIYDLTINKDGEIDPKNITKKLVNHIKKLKPSYATGIDCESTKSIAFNEFRIMLDLNTSMKKCKNCGNYFILKGDYVTDYCDSIPKGEKYTCKKIAAIAARKEKVNANPILKEYEKAYKRNYARSNNNKITQEEFRQWVVEATKKRDITEEQYNNNPNESIIKEFKKYLGNK